MPASVSEKLARENEVRAVWADECVKRGIDPEQPTEEADLMLFEAMVVAFADEEKWGSSWFSEVAKLRREQSA